MFAIRQAGDGKWEVYETESDQPVTVDGMPLTDPDEAEAKEAIELLQAGELTPD